MADFTNPLSGSVIADFERTENATTITCNITDGTQITTQWNLENFENRPPGVLVSIVNLPQLFKISGDPRPDSGTYENQLTVLNLTRELDEVIVYCGTGANPREANFLLRIYSKSLTDYKTLETTALFFCRIFSVQDLPSCVTISL